jgi:glutamate formiminotransferase
VLPPPDLLECVVNVSEGRDLAGLATLADAAGPPLLDVHADADHHRAVLTLGGPSEAVEAAVRSLASAVVATVDVTAHAGAHPRIGALDVVPFVTLAGWPPGPVVDGPMEAAVAARDRFVRWAAEALELPCFVYGPSGVGAPPRSLPAVRRGAWSELAPDAGPSGPHPTAGACAAGARPILVAYNLWLASPDLAVARRIAAEVRQPGRLRALGLSVGDAAQVSCNLIDPWTVGPEAAFDAVASRTDVARAELVGLLPRDVLQRARRHRWRELDLDPSATIEARLDQAGLDGGRFRPHRLA